MKADVFKKRRDPTALPFAAFERKTAVFFQFGIPFRCKAAVKGQAVFAAVKRHARFPLHFTLQRCDFICTDIRRIGNDQIGLRQPGKSAGAAQNVAPNAAAPSRLGAVRYT